MSKWFSMSIEIRGLDKFSKKLEELQEGLTLPGLQHWAKKVEQQACTLAIASTRASLDDIRENINVDVEEIEPEKYQIKAKTKQEFLQYIKEAIITTMDQMPLTTKALFEAFLKQIEKKMEKPI